MALSRSTIRIAVWMALGFAPVLTWAQSEPGGRSVARAAAVEFLFPEQITIPAGKPATVALHFRIAPGLHINSHTPSEEDLVATTLTVPAESGVRLESASYPPGTAFALPLEPKTKLSVYTGEFTIEARLVALPGDHLVEARLRYQACDNAACMPPKTITVAIDVQGK